MNPQLLQTSFLGISMYQDDYNKVKCLLPTPSYSDKLYSKHNTKVILIYALEGYISSYNQYRWISNIKLGLEKYLCVPFTYEDEFYITDSTEITAILYTIDELSKAFKASLITYPKIMYPSTKKELYKHLCWYGKSLIHQQVFTKEAMVSSALLMNSKLKDRYSNKELIKKALGAYTFIHENKENFRVKLNSIELKKAHVNGANITNKNQREKTKSKIDNLLKDNRYIKPNGKANKTLISKVLGMHRRTLDKYL